MIPIDVDCYAGYRGEETPRRIRFKTHTVSVQVVLDRWLSPDHRYFKVTGDDGDLYIIRNDPLQGLWELTFYRAARIPIRIVVCFEIKAYECLNFLTFEAGI